MFRLRRNLARAVCGYIKRHGGVKAFKTIDLIGCNRHELRAHLERLFKPGMTWENYGRIWHVDHKKPCSLFNLADVEEQRTCFHWSNLQPLFAAENISKGNRYVA